MPISVLDSTLRVQEGCSILKCEAGRLFQVLARWAQLQRKKQAERRMWQIWCLGSQDPTLLPYSRTLQNSDIQSGAHWLYGSKPPSRVGEAVHSVPPWPQTP